MLHRLSPHKRVRAKELIRQLDRIAADLNIVLILFALGLAVLDATFLVTYAVNNPPPGATESAFAAQPAPGR